MPRDGSNIYHRPAGTDGVPNFPIESSKYNAFAADLEQDLNLPRPIVAGGTGANNATDALFNVKGEIATQIVTNWDSQVWVPGSFYAASTATGTAPVAGHNFAGQVYIGEALANPPTNLNVVLEARDLDNATPPGASYVRQKKAGVWSAWTAGTIGTLTDAEKTAARQQIYAAPFDALAYSGMQINGSIDVSQELGFSGRTTDGYFCDGWRVDHTGTMVQNTVVTSAGTNIPGFTNTIASSTTTAQASIGAGDYTIISYLIEGYRVARLGWGMANAQPITIGFWSWHTRVGTYSVGIRNSGSTRSYYTTYTQNLTTFPEYKTITIPGDVTGTWNSTSGTGIQLIFTLACGTTFTAPAINTWYGVNYLSAPGQTNGVATTSDVFRITGVVVLPGIEAPSAARSPLIMRPFNQELITCQRYYQKTYDYGTVPNSTTTFAGARSGIVDSSTTRVPGPFLFDGGEMRISPIMVMYSPTLQQVGKWEVAGGAVTAISVVGPGTKSFMYFNIAAVAANTMVYGHWTADARL